MKIGIPKEIKQDEYRVSVVPSGVQELRKHGHEVLVESCAGTEVGLSNAMYQDAGATIVNNAEDIYQDANLIVKVKEPQLSECQQLSETQTIFCFLHLAADPQQAQALLQSKVAAIAYETVTSDVGGLPLLQPMSEIAGRLSIQLGAHGLEKVQAGRGVLLGGVPGVPQGQVFILGAGVVGANAANIALGMGASVTIVDTCVDKLRSIDERFGHAVTTEFSTQESIERHLEDADLVIGAVLIPGGSAPRLITKQMLVGMQAGAVMVDVAIDQGGCFETSQPTTYRSPSYVVDNIVHQCVTNLPGGVPRTSTFALANATLPYIIQLANKGTVKACLDNLHLERGMNIFRGAVTHPAVADSLNYQHYALETLANNP